MMIRRWLRFDMSSRWHRVADRHRLNLLPNSNCKTLWLRVPTVSGMSMMARCRNSVRRSFLGYRFGGTAWQGCFAPLEHSHAPADARRAGGDGGARCRPLGLSSLAARERTGRAARRGGGVAAAES